MAKTAAPIVEFSGIEISYREEDNRWVFELDGREKSAESLNKAKEIISAPKPKEKKPFTRFTAYYGGGYYSGNYKAVEVTSIAEPSSYEKEPHYWISGSEGRKKVQGSSLVEATPENSGRLADIANIKKEIEQLNAKQRAVEQSLTKVAAHDR